MTDWETRYYEQQALHTEARGMLCMERDSYKAKRDLLLAENAKLREALIKAGREIGCGDPRDLAYDCDLCGEIRAAVAVAEVDRAERFFLKHTRPALEVLTEPVAEGEPPYPFCRHKAKCIESGRCMSEICCAD